MLRPLVLAFVALSPCFFHAQVTGFSYELDTVFAANEPLGLADYGVHNVYANFTHSEDVLGAVYSDVDALGTPPMGIDAPCGCHNPAATSVVVDVSNNPAFFAYSLTTNTIPFNHRDETRMRPTIASQH